MFTLVGGGHQLPILVASAAAALLNTSIIGVVSQPARFYAADQPLSICCLSLFILFGEFTFGLEGCSVVLWIIPPRLAQRRCFVRPHQPLSH